MHTNTQFCRLCKVKSHFSILQGEEHCWNSTCAVVHLMYKYSRYSRLVLKYGTIIGGLSPRRIRRGSDRIRSDPIGSDRIRQPVRQSVRRGGLRRTQADPKKVRRVRLSPPRIRSDPIGSAINWRTVRQKMAEKSCNRKVRGGQSTLLGRQSPLLGGQSPPLIKSAADKVRQRPPGEKYPGKNNRRTLSAAD